MTRKSHLLLALFATSALSPVAVQAADLPAPMMEEVPALVSWTGFYFGIEGGGGAYNHDTTFNLGGPFNFNFDGFSGEGWQLGGTLGFDWQVGGTPFVLGVLADGHWSNMRSGGQRHWWPCAGEPGEPMGRRLPWSRRLAPDPRRSGLCARRRQLGAV